MPLIAVGGRIIMGEQITGDVMAAGRWPLAAGGWRLAAGGWRLAAGGWRLNCALRKSERRCRTHGPLHQHPR